MLEVWACEGCGRVGHSERDLLVQGCEGRPERFLPARCIEEIAEIAPTELDLAHSDGGYDCGQIARKALADD